MRNALRALAPVVIVLIGVLPSAVRADSDWNHTPKSTPPGVEHKTFQSKSMNVEVGYNIYLPPDYATSGDKRFPVVYFLHGRGGNEGSGMFIFELFDKAIKEKQIPSMIYVTACGEKNSGYVDSPDGTIMSDTAIMKELIPHVDATYRTIAAKGGRAVEGFSMGGQGAILFAFKYPEMFSAVCGYGAGLARGAELKKELPAVFKKMHNDNIEQFDGTSAWFYARQNADRIRGSVAIKLGLGSKDPHLERNHRMDALLEELKISHEYKELPGIGHDTRKVYQEISVDGWKFEAEHMSLLTAPHGKP
jgi:endo-1,4-beta-xylanase